MVLMLCSDTYKAMSSPVWCGVWCVSWWEISITSFMNPCMNTYFQFVFSLCICNPYTWYNKYGIVFLKEDVIFYLNQITHILIHKQVLHLMLYSTVHYCSCISICVNPYQKHISWDVLYKWMGICKTFIMLPYKTMLLASSYHSISLLWRHNEHDSVSYHQPRGCLLDRLFRRRSKKTSKLRVTGLCVGNSPGPVNSPHKGPVTRKMFPFDDVIMCWPRPRKKHHPSSLNLTIFIARLNWESISRSVALQNNRDLNQCILHLWSKFGDPSLNGWWVMVRTSPEWCKFWLWP